MAFVVAQRVPGVEKLDVSLFRDVFRGFQKT